MVERVGDFRDVDYSVGFLMHNLVDFFSEKENWKPKDRPYVLAMLKLAAHHPDKFRRNGYTFNGVRFSQHKNDKKGKLVSCVADFGGCVPSEEKLQNYLRKQEEETAALCENK
jgi:hypothetical protein